MKKLMMVVMATMLIGCSTFQVIKSGGTWQQVGIASCSDMRIGVTGASAAVAWTRIYFPNQQEFFTSTIDPLLLKATFALDAYCTAADLVNDVDSFQDLLAKQAEIVKLVGQIKAFLVEVKK